MNVGWRVSIMWHTVLIALNELIQNESCVLRADGSTLPMYGLASEVMLV